MSIKLKDAVPLDNIDEFKTWTEIFDAQARSKELTDQEKLTDQFLSNAGLKELIKIKRLVAPRTVTKMKWDEIKVAITKFLEPKKKLLIAERTVFMQMRQQDDESVGEFAARLRTQAVKCEFETFKNASVDPAEELTRMRLIAGIHDDLTRNKILEKELTTKLTTDEIVDFTMQLIQVREFVSSGKTENASLASAENINASAKSEDQYLCLEDERVNMSNVSSYTEKQNKKKCYRCGSQ